MSRQPNMRRGTGGTRVVVVLTAIVVLLAPLGVWASHRFSDVPDSNVFHEDISWLAESGVTIGCNPPENTLYCPSDNVTREQMAAFLRRLAENRVVDADTATTAERAGQADHADHADSADAADTVDGKHADELGAYLTGRHVDIVTGGQQVNLAAGNPTRVLTIQLEESNGAYALADYGASLLQPGGQPIAALFWLQVNNDSCNVQSPDYVSGSLITILEIAPLAAVSSGVVAQVSGSTELTLCARATGTPAVATVANLNAVQSHQGSATVAEVTEGPVSGSVDPDDPFGLEEFLNQLDEK